MTAGWLLQDEQNFESSHLVWAAKLKADMQALRLGKPLPA
jgi:hypothetical protein